MYKVPTYASPFQVPADVEKCQDRMECFNADLKADMERWQNNKRQDFRQLLMGMADKNIQYYEKVTRTRNETTALSRRKRLRQQGPFINACPKPRSRDPASPTFFPSFMCLFLATLAMSLPSCARCGADFRSRCPAGAHRGFTFTHCRWQQQF